MEVLPASASGPSDPFRLGHRPWLDGLRGVAILTVVAYHLRLLPGGLLGVDLFFVLSGFLITSLLLEEYREHGAIRLRHFYQRRALRLLPALCLVLLGASVWMAFHSPDKLKHLRREVMVVMCFATNMQDRLHTVPMHEFGFTWSLSLEEQFYLVWPAALLLLLRFRAPKRVILGVIGVGIVVPAVVRFWLYTQLPPPTDPWFVPTLLKLYTRPETRGDSLLCGCLVAALAHWGYLPRTPDQCRRVQTAATFSLGLTIGWVTGLYLHHPITYCGGFTVFGLATASVLVCMLSAPLPTLRRALESAPLVAAGRISYGLFLYHMPILGMLGIEQSRVGWHWPTNTLAVFGVSLLAAVASYHGIERPVMRLKNRFKPSAAPVTPVVETPPPARQAA